MEKKPNEASLLDRWKNREQKKTIENSIEKAPSKIKSPLSYGQKRLWFLQQMYPGNPFYNYSETYTFKGNLDQKSLIESLKKVYYDNDILRTTYHLEDGEVFQKIDSTAVIDIKIHDLSALSEVDSNATTQKILEADATKSFDLTKSPLVRVSLMKMKVDCHIFQITLHHIVTDKWSMRIFREHLASYYNELTSNTTITNKRTNLQYLDFAYWLDKKEINRQHLSYWKNKLSGDIPVLNLPTDHARPMQPSFKGLASFTQKFDRPLSGGLLELSKQLGTTPFTLMLSVYYILLYRYSGQTDILIGSPVTNRDQKVLEDLIGFFNDTIVLRTKLTPSMTFKQLLAEVSKNTLDAFSNKDIPFDILVKELKVERSLAVNPFFQVMFLYHSVQENPFFSNSLNLTHTWFDSKVSKFDLTIYVSEENGILSSTFEYATDLFQEETINRFQDYYKLLLKGVVANPNQSIEKITMLTPSENDFFLIQEKDKQNHFSDYKGIHHIIENIGHSYSDKIAITFNDSSITYQQLNDRANSIASSLLKRTKNNNEIVGLCIDRSVDMIVGMLGILKSGCAYLPLDSDYPEDRIQYMITDAKVKHVITQHHHTPLFKQQEVMLIDAVEPMDISTNSEFPLSKEHDLAYVIYTSGSAGKPKGVPISHKNIINSTNGRLNFYKSNPKVFLLMSSISFDSAMAGIFWTLCTGGNLVVTEKRIEQNMDKIGNLIEMNKITHSLMLPTVYNLVLEYVNKQKITSLNTIVVAGEACPIALCKKHLSTLSNTTMYNEYGPTETSVWCIAHKIERKDLDAEQIPIGKSVADAKIYLLNENLNLVPFGAIGEIYISGDGLSEGYLNNINLTEEVFINNPFQTGEKLYKTGDLGKFNNDGNILFLGRADQQIKIRGFRVELSEIENTIKAFGSIKDAVVLVEDDTSNFNFENSDQAMPLAKIVDILKNMDDNELDGIFSSIQSLNNDEKEYLLNQIEP